MSTSLYRKYRPENFSQVIGQKHIVRSLSNAITSNRISHAYLFTGPRGTGKTSIARIFAKTVNCLDLQSADACGKCSNCRLVQDGRSLDIIEIDAASHTGVENIRELRETVSLPPTMLRYKIYIIDEVHMLSTGAFNALLKTLEEPPAHVIFILATTEIHKVPETIISRCQRFDFTRLPIQSIIEKLTLIAKKEKVKIDRGSLEMIAITAEGGMRDAESLLGQVMALEDKDITVKEVEEILGTTDKDKADRLAELLIDGNTREAIAMINSVVDDGYDLKVFNKSLINTLRQLMLVKVNPELKSYFAYEVTRENMEKIIALSKKAELAQLIQTINLFLDAQPKISAFLLPQLPLEIAAIKATRSPASNPGIQPAQNRAETKKIKEAEPIIPSSPLKPEKNEKAAEKENQENDSLSADVKIITLDDARNNWPQFLKKIKPYNHSLATLFSNCQIISVENNQILLATGYSFYKDKLNQAENRLTAQEVFDKILGSKISLKAVTFQEAGLETPKKIEPSSDSMENERNGSQEAFLDSALKIIGGKIVDE